MVEQPGLLRVSPSRLARLLEAQQAANIDIQHAQIGCARIRYAVKPGVGEPLLLCNGIGANLELMLPLLKYLKRPVVVLDLPGTGGSESTFFWPSLRRYSRFAMGVLDHAGYTGRFAVAGVSWGGGLAQQIARHHHKRVSHLILMATSPGIIMLPGRISAIRRMATPQRYLSRGYMAKNASAIYGGELRNAPYKAVEHARLIMPPTGLAYVQQLLAMWGFSSLPWLHRLRCPTLIICGDDDPLIHLGNGHLLAKLIPGAKLHIMRGGGHLFMTMRSAETAELLNTWIESGSVIDSF